MHHYQTQHNSALANSYSTRTVSARMDPSQNRKAQGAFRSRKDNPQPSEVARPQTVMERGGKWVPVATGGTSADMMPSGRGLGSTGLSAQHVGFVVPGPGPMDGPSPAYTYLGYQHPLYHLPQGDINGISYAPPKASPPQSSAPTVSPPQPPSTAPTTQPSNLIRDAPAPYAYDFSDRALVIRLARSKLARATDYTWTEHYDILHSSYKQALIAELNRKLHRGLKPKPLLREMDSKCVDAGFHAYLAFARSGMQQEIEWRWCTEHLDILRHVRLERVELGLEELDHILRHVRLERVELGLEELDRVVKMAGAWTLEEKEEEEKEEEEEEDD
ncbi:hypothetical protein BU26DRAFT_508045 [Trematosphaeria pertusa]|uniref:Uncharacterized protein n=1 Tax=Trematosphaeria pertusa TaxID=390896 RepID=A0A6A6I4D6_9PLEO|nr:uncharacterized protein BU26DRAFT_508045 [Trematosphaeria pertusa]KAF2245374.1 hypothetical protein BU26DRAFT_508045 [Trematosphaeria pertusa]